MRKIIFWLALASQSLSFAATPKPYLSVENKTRQTTVVVSYETQSEKGQMTILPGTSIGSPPFPEGEAVKNIQFKVLGGQVVDKSSCGFVFDQLYRQVSLQFGNATSMTGEEKVKVVCNMRQ